MVVTCSQKVAKMSFHLRYKANETDGKKLVIEQVKQSDACNLIALKKKGIVSKYAIMLFEDLRQQSCMMAAEN